jgi:hypothetical protein
LLSIAPLELVQGFALVNGQDINHVGMSLHQDFGDIAFSSLSLNLPHDLVGNCLLAFDITLGFAMSARLAQRTNNRVTSTLAGHLDQSQFRNF